MVIRVKDRAWQQASRYWPDDKLGELLERIGADEQMIGGRGVQISTASALVTVRPGALKRPQVLNLVTGAVHE